MSHDFLAVLQQTLLREMPICRAMGIQAAAWQEERLVMEMPLEPNRNHQDSAFAGSLNALCTITGWGTVFLLLHQRQLTGNIVIRRSSIRYLVPVRSPQVVARGRAIDAGDVDYFFELLASKGRSKIDCDVQIHVGSTLALSFHGSYVVQEVC